MRLQFQFDAEMGQLQSDYENGHISIHVYNRAVRDLEREYRECAEESAREAYDREMENW